MKKVFSFIIVLSMLFLCALPAFAAEGETVEKGTLFDYRFKFFSDSEAETIAQEIAQNCRFAPVLLGPDIESIVISVDLRAYPELSNINVLTKASRAIVDRSKEIVTNTTENVELLSYTRFAG